MGGVAQIIANKKKKRKAHTNECHFTKAAVRSAKCSWLWLVGVYVFVYARAFVCVCVCASVSSCFSFPLTVIDAGAFGVEFAYRLDFHRCCWLINHTFSLIKSI